jgi:hypothetical protein
MRRWLRPFLSRILKPQLTYLSTKVRLTIVAPSRVSSTSESAQIVAKSMLVEHARRKATTHAIRNAAFWRFKLNVDDGDGHGHHIGMPPEKRLDYLHELHWSVDEFQTTDGQWHLYGHRGKEKILGRGTTQTKAWQAAAMAAESII